MRTEVPAENSQGGSRRKSTLEQLDLSKVPAHNPGLASPNQPGTTTSPKPQGFATPGSVDELQRVAAEGAALHAAMGSDRGTQTPGAPLHRAETVAAILSPSEASKDIANSTKGEDPVTQPEAVRASHPIEVDTHTQASAHPSKAKERVIIAVRLGVASIPSIMFAALALDNVQPDLYGLIPIGLVGMLIEKGLFPAASYLVNLATSYEEQYNYIIGLLRMCATQTTHKDKAAFLLTNVIAFIAAVATMPMARDAAQTMGIASQNPHVNSAYQISSIFCMSGLYTVVTRQTASHGLIFNEIPDFVRWVNRKARMLFTADAEAVYFSQDVLRFIEKDLKTEAQFRELKLLLRSEETIEAAAFAEFLNNAGYRPYPSKAKTVATSLLLVASLLLGFLLNSLSYKGAKALDLPDLAAKGVAATSTAVTEIFYVRAVMKFFDRAMTAYSTTKAAYIGSSVPALIAYHVFFALSVLALTLATSAGFVFEARKYTEDYGRTIQELYKLCWTIYAGLVANVGYTFLQMGNIAQAKLDAKETARALYDSAGVAVLSEGESAKADAADLKAAFITRFTQPAEVRSHFNAGLFSSAVESSDRRRGSDRGSAISLPGLEAGLLNQNP